MPKASASSPKTKPKDRPKPVADGYTTRIIKAGALLDDTKTLLAYWDVTRPVTENLDRARRENVFGKASRSRVENILAVFRQRYLADAVALCGLVTLAQKKLPAAALDKVLYFHAARADALLRDTVTELLGPLQAQGKPDVPVHDVVTALRRWVEEGRATTRWSGPTTRRVAQGLLSTLRDFGVLTGAVNKRIGPTYLPVKAFAYVAFLLRQRQPSGSLLVGAADWELFFLSRAAVERFLVEADQARLLEYQAAGSVVRIAFPADTPEGYARVLTS
jgi:hypothetical protein